MNILGISFTHDGTITVLKDGKNVFSIGEERLNRIKSYIGFPFQGLRYAIEHQIIDPKTIDAVAISANVFKKEWAWTFAFILTEDKKYFDIQNHKKPADFYLNDTDWQNIKTDDECRFYVEEKLKKILSASGITAPIVFYDHHLAHAASAYFTGGRPEALSISLDGEGDLKSGSINVCKDGKIETIHTMPVESSIGWLYSEVTRACGFRISRHEGKITGLAAYGDPAKSMDYLRKEVFVKDGTITFPRSSKARRLLSRVKAKLNLSPYYNNTWKEVIGEAGKLSNEDLSAGVQTILEETVTQLVSHWVKKTGVAHVVASGGVFANVKLNEKIAELPEVKSLFIYPDMGDGGNAYGAAALHYHTVKPFNAQREKIAKAYLGPEFSDEQIEVILQNYSELEYSKSANIAKDTAQLLANKTIVGWFQGRMEYGPRALGNRSIVADPTDPTINKWLNQRMKRTEFMPFAPSCLYEAADKVFKIEKDTMKFPAEFMTITFPMKDVWAKKAGAVAHVDKTARPQLVRKEVNPLYHALLTEFEKLTGLPLFINTSFNVHEEPIVCKPDEAIKSLVNDVIDVLAIGNFIVRKKK